MEELEEDVETHVKQTVGQKDLLSVIRLSVGQSLPWLLGAGSQQPPHSIYVNI